MAGKRYLQRHNQQRHAVVSMASHVSMAHTLGKVLSNACTTQMSLFLVLQADAGASTTAHATVQVAAPSDIVNMRARPQLADESPAFLPVSRVRAEQLCALPGGLPRLKGPRHAHTPQCGTPSATHTGAFGPHTVRRYAVPHQAASRQAAAAPMVPCARPGWRHARHV
jgi:hypothetical protein